MIKKNTVKQILKEHIMVFEIMNCKQELYGKVHTYNKKTN